MMWIDVLLYYVDRMCFLIGSLVLQVWDLRVGAEMDDWTALSEPSLDKAFKHGKDIVGVAARDKMEGMQAFCCEYVSTWDINSTDNKKSGLNEQTKTKRVGNGNDMGMRIDFVNTWGFGKAPWAGCVMVAHGLSLGIGIGQWDLSISLVGCMHGLELVVFGEADP